MLEANAITQRPKIGHGYDVNSRPCWVCALKSDKKDLFGWDGLEAMSWWKWHLTFRSWNYGYSFTELKQFTQSRCKTGFCGHWLVEVLWITNVLEWQLVGTSGLLERLAKLLISQSSESPSAEPGALGKAELCTSPLCYQHPDFPSEVFWGHPAPVPIEVWRDSLIL